MCVCVYVCFRVRVCVCVHQMRRAFMYAALYVC